MNPSDILRAVSELDPRDARVVLLGLDDGAHDVYGASLSTVLRTQPHFDVSAMAGAGMTNAAAYEELVRR